MTTQTKKENRKYLTNQPSVYVTTKHKYRSTCTHEGAWLYPYNYSGCKAFEDACYEIHKDEDDPEFILQYFKNLPRYMNRKITTIKGLFEYLDCINSDNLSQSAIEAGVETSEYLKFIENSFLSQSAIEAGVEAGIPLESIEDAYQGRYDNDEDFAYQRAEEDEVILRDMEWPMGYIDWKRAARDYMRDYSKANGYYFSKNG